MSPTSKKEEGEPVDSDSKTFVKWILGINASLVLLGIGVVGSALWNLNGKVADTNQTVAVMNVKLENAEKSRTDVNAGQVEILKITAATQQRQLELDRRVFELEHPRNSAQPQRP